MANKKIINDHSSQSLIAFAAWNKKVSSKQYGLTNDSLSLITVGTNHTLPHPRDTNKTLTAYRWTTQSLHSCIN